MYLNPVFAYKDLLEIFDKRIFTRINKYHIKYSVLLVIFIWDLSAI